MRESLTSHHAAPHISTAVLFILVFETKKNVAELPYGVVCSLFPTREMGALDCHIISPGHISAPSDAPEPVPKNPSCAWGGYSCGISYFGPRDASVPFRVPAQSTTVHQGGGALRRGTLAVASQAVAEIPLGLQITLNCWAPN